MRRSSTQLLLGAVWLLASLAWSPSTVRAIDNPWNVASGNWNTASNWLNNQVPSRALDDFPVISNGGTATLSSAAANTVGGVVIGQNAGETGVLEILPGGSLTSTNTGTGTGDGVVRVGVGGNGTLRMTGGTLNTTRGIDLGQNALNRLELSGNATITSAGNFSLGGTTAVTGSTVSVSALNYNLRTSSAYVAGINSNTQFSTLKTSTPSGVVTVQGSFTAAFTGVTPPVGSTWSIFEGGAVVGNFNNAANVTVTGVPATVTGEAYRTRIVNGGAFGKKLELVHDSVLALEVNRDTGAVAILNPLNGSIPINSYSINSAVGSLKPANGNWNSLTDQATANWEEANPTAKVLAELNKTTGGNFNFASVPSKSLGNAYDDGAAFFTGGIGTAGNDLVFDYLTNAGELIRGQVVYTGVGKTNDLLVTINPANGNAVLKNDSPGTITTDGFSVLSTGAALVPGSFGGLGSPLLANAAPTSSALSQLAINPNNPLPIGQGTTFNLGKIFNTASALSGVSLEFTIQGVNHPFNGVVRFQTAVNGDYNNDNKVDGADILVVQRGLGTIYNDTDLAAVSSNFGVGGVVAAAGAVPEPACLGLMLTALAAGGATRRRRGAGAA